MTPALSLRDLAARNSKTTHSLLEENSGLIKTFNGSVALYQAVEALDLTPGDVILLPAYCCGAELGPFLYRDCRCEFFDVDDELNIDVEEIKQLFEEHDRCKALVVIG